MTSNKTLKKTIVVLLFIIALLSMSMFYIYAQTGTTFTLSPGIYPGAPSYTIWREGSTYYGKDEYGVLAYSGTNATVLINAVDNAITGGAIFLKAGIYELDAPINLNPSNSLIGEHLTERDSISLRPTSNFPNGEYLIRVETSSIQAVCGHIENLMLYNSLFASVTSNGILINATGWNGAGGGLMLNGLIRNVVFQYMNNDLYFEGYVFHWTVDSLKVNGIPNTMDSHIVLARGSPIHADNLPKFNYFKNIVISGTPGRTKTNMLRIEEGYYNTFEIKAYALGSHDHSVVSIQNGQYNTIEFEALDAGWTVNTVASIIISNDTSENFVSTGNIIKASFINAPSQMPIVIEKGATQNHISFIPWTQVIYVNATGAGVDNVIEFLSVGSMTGLTISGGETNFRLLGAGVQNSGNTTISASTTVVVNHGLIATPTLVSVTIGATGYGSHWVDTFTSTQFTVHVNNSGTYPVYWKAEYQP